MLQILNCKLIALSPLISRRRDYSRSNDDDEIAMNVSFNEQLPPLEETYAEPSCPHTTLPHKISPVGIQHPSASNVDLLEERDEVEDLEMKTGQGGCGKVYS